MLVVEEGLDVRVATIELRDDSIALAPGLLDPFAGRPVTELVHLRDSVVGASELDGDLFEGLSVVVLGEEGVDLSLGPVLSDLCGRLECAVLGFFHCIAFRYWLMLIVILYTDSNPMYIFIKE